MAKKKIAESIIIRVGGGIREIRREPILDVVDPDDFEQSEDVRSFESKHGSTLTKSKDKTIN
jgi:hypothetical protein